jgi:predicted acyltransferase
MVKWSLPGTTLILLHAHILTQNLPVVLYSFRFNLSPRLVRVLTTNMHETGHNLGFGHSSENMIRGDKSGSMGSSLFRVWNCLQCWNGHKYSMGGWLWDHFPVDRSATDPTPG